MYKQYFGLRDNPFSIAPDPHYLYLGARDREAMAHFEYGIQVSGGFVQLTGEVGTGKTLLVRALLQQLPEDVDVALVLNPVMTVVEFVAAVCDELQVPYNKRSKSLKALIDALNQFLLKNHAAGQRTVLIMDEAQNLSRDVLEQLRLLTNLETSKDKLLQIILVGQPELKEKLATYDLRQLAQRITARYELRGWNRLETHAYIRHRCNVAGANRILFTQSAMNWAYRLSAGNPRMINILCDRALLGAYSRNESRVSPAPLRQAAREVGESVPGRYWLWAPVAIPTSLAASAILGVAIWYFSTGAGLSVFNAAVADRIAATRPDPSAQQRRVVTVKHSPMIQREAAMGLADLLRQPASHQETEDVFRELFARWNQRDVTFAGRSGCEVAEQLGLECIFNTGTWNHLRSFNRPALIELLDDRGRRHHLLVSGLRDDQVSLVLGGREQTFPISEVDRLWYGKYLLVWHPPAVAAGSLRRGQQGPGVTWLREVLSRYDGKAVADTPSDVFDSELEARIKGFQSQHQLVADGVVGRFTLMRLNNYYLEQTPPLLYEAGLAQTG
ncbi:MAG: ExeA family protein [Gammaproteobacteria bacterium]|nr:MAG: ExeA family protein [Gammaproteobacteria bacterium]